MKQENKLILGCMGLGGGWNQNPITSSDEIQAQEAIEAALEAGIRTFDHADIYAFGKAESVFGTVLKQNPTLREKMHIQSKTGIIIGAGPEGSSTYNNSKEYIISHTEQILKRLNTEYLDSLLIHRPDALMDGYQIAEAFEYLKDKGLVKAFGVSNMSVSQMELVSHYWPEPLFANQIQVSLGHADILNMGVDVNTDAFHHNGSEGILQYAQIHHVPIQAWSPLDRGRFIKNLDEVAPSDKKTATVLLSLAEKYGVTPNVIVIAWLFKLPVLMHPIIGTANPERIKDSAKALTVDLTREDWYDLYITARGTRLP